MQKWEYCNIEFTAGGPLARANATLTIYQVDGNHKEFNNLFGILAAKLGEDGWEMVGSQAAGTTPTGIHKLNCIFKRPKSDDAIS